MTTGTRRPRVLVTGFEPFADAERNPSGDVVRRLQDDGIDGVDLATRILPVEFREGGRRLLSAMDEHEPDLVVALGLAEGRLAITPERVAINLADARIPDNAGAQPRDEAIEAGGPAARFTTLPVKAMTAALEAAGLPGGVSLTAGSFVCNELFYTLLGEAERRPGVRAGFVHVPAGADLALDDLERGVRVLIATALGVDRDALIVGGSLH